jgi:hypothetical protein
MAGLPIDMLSNIRYYIDDHKRGVFEAGAPTTDVLEVTGRPAEDFETIARAIRRSPSISGRSAIGFVSSRSS